MSRRRKQQEAEEGALANTGDLGRAFPIYPCPGSSAVVPFPGDDERSAAAKLLAGKTWPALTWEYVDANYPCDLSALPCWLTPAGFVYYLPAFIRMCREHPNDVNCLAEAVLNAFGRQHGAWQSTLAGLDTSQRACVYQFLHEHFTEQVCVGTEPVESYGFWKPYMEQARRVLGYEAREESPAHAV